VHVTKTGLRNGL